MYAGTADARFKARADLIVAELAKVQQALTEKGAGIGYLSAFPVELIDRVETRKPVWAPYYTLHKIMTIFRVLDELVEDRALLVDGQVKRGEPCLQLAAPEITHGCLR